MLPEKKKQHKAEIDNVVEWRTNPLCFTSQSQNLSTGVRVDLWQDVRLDYATVISCTARFVQWYEKTYGRGKVDWERVRFWYVDF